MSAPRHNEGLFRKVALERLSSPDRLDALLGINPPKVGWIGVGVVLALAITLYWGIAGRIEQRVAGRCVLISGSGVAEVTTNAAGTLTGLGVKVGDTIEAGAIIGRVVRRSLFEQIEQAERRLAELEARRREIEKLGDAAVRQGRDAAAGERASIAEQLGLAAERARALEERLRVERALVDQGLLTRQTVLDSEQALSAQVLEQERLRDRERQLAVQVAEDRRQRNRDQVSIDFQINEARRSLNALREQEQAYSPVRSPYRGRVIEIKAREGALVAYGAEVLQLELSEPGQGTVEAAIYLPGGEGKLLAVGMPVEVVPDYVKRQEFGFVRGSIAQVSEFPASTPAMRPLVQNDNLLRELAGQRAPIFARARLAQRDDGGYAWSAAATNAPAVRSGALCRAEVTVGERRPIGMLVPALRRWLGIA